MSDFTVRDNADDDDEHVKNHHDHHLSKDRMIPGELVDRVNPKLKTTKVVLPKVTFQRIVREITKDKLGHPELRFKSKAMEALQEAAEIYMAEVFIDAALCAKHAKRQTLHVKDMQLARRIRGDTHRFGA